MPIPLSRPDLSPLEQRYVLEVLQSGRLSLGPKLTQFEDLFRQKFNVKHAVAMNSGTSALHVAVKALGLGPGDEVITTPYSFIASSNCLLYEGVDPVFVDIDRHTFNMDVSQVERAITPRTKAILVVHLFGQPAPMDRLLRIAAKYKLPVIEDACEAIGATWQQRYAGTWGKVGVFGFYPNKQITTGEGGMLLTNDDETYQLAASLRNQGRNVGSPWLEHERIGYNYRMSELQAALGLAQLERLEEILAKREKVAQGYLKLLAEARLPVSTPKIDPSCRMSWFVFVIILPRNIRRERVMKVLASKGVETKPYFPPIHLQEPYARQFGFKPGTYPIAEEMGQRTLALPFYTALKEEEQRYVVKALQEALLGVREDD